MSTLDLARPADSSESEDDDDYVPSAEESEGDLSDADNAADSDVEEVAPKKQKKGKRGGIVPRKRRGGIKVELEDDNDQEGHHDAAEELKEETALEPGKEAEEEKKKADRLWSDFLKDVEPIPKRRPAGTQDSTKASSVASSSAAQQTPNLGEKKVKITQVLDFAGEAVVVNKEVAADSKEAKLFAKQQEEESEKPAARNVGVPGVKRPGGIGNVLGQLLNKKQKMSTLEKSKLDWDMYKQKEGIVEELQAHNRGKDGYLEKQAFLQRADVRQFEIEKNLRAKARVKRIV